MTEQFVSKSRIFFEGWMPGGVRRLQNESFAMVVGASNNDEESRQIDREQLVSIVKKYVLEWKDLPNAEVDYRLESAVEHPELSLEVVCPEALYVDPFPMMLRCSCCQVLEYHQHFSKTDESIKKAERLIIDRDGRKVIPCRRNCGGVMQQVPYVAIHRCGSITPIDIPFESRRISQLGYKDHSGSFLQSYFFDVTTGKQTDHSLQMKCPSCKGKYDRSAKQGRPIANPDCFHVHNLQYLCLKEDTGRLVSRVTTLFGADDHSGISGDIAEAVVSTLLGLNEPFELAKHLSDALNSDGTDSGQIEEILQELEKQNKALKDASKLKSQLGEVTWAQISQTLQEKIDALEESLVKASGRFSSVRELFSVPGILDNLGLHRRAIERL